MLDEVATKVCFTIGTTMEVLVSVWKLNIFHTTYHGSHKEI